MSEATSTKETLGFQAEVKQLLDLMIHSLYSNKEIFLRELISNASDACDKLRFEALTDTACSRTTASSRSASVIDKAARTLTVADNGIGMSRDEVISNLGTIAQSGTREFFRQLTGDRPRTQSDRPVRRGLLFVVHRGRQSHARDTPAGLPAGEGVRWESDGSGEYTSRRSKNRRAAPTSPSTCARATTICCRARNCAIIRKYSDHISLPIGMKKENWDEKKSEDQLTMTTRSSTRRARCGRGRKPRSREEHYEEFYKHLTHDFEPPLAYTHTRVEGNTEYTQLLFVPKRAPFDLLDRRHRHGVQLYVRRVFIMDDAEQLMPAYLRFIRGVIDSQRPATQCVARAPAGKSNDVGMIRARRVHRVLGHARGPGRPTRRRPPTFWKEFGQVLKEGRGRGLGPRNASPRLLRFASTQPTRTSRRVAGRLRRADETRAAERSTT